jgi:hypothetical protein
MILFKLLVVEKRAKERKEHRNDKDVEWCLICKVELHEVWFIDRNVCRWDEYLARYDRDEFGNTCSPKCSCKYPTLLIHMGSNWNV